MFGDLQSEVTSVALGRLGPREVIVAGSNSYDVRVWDGICGERLAVLEKLLGSVSAVALGRLGPREVIVSGGWDAGMRVWDGVSGECLAVLKGHQHGVSTVALGRMGPHEVIVSGSWDSTIRIWDVASALAATPDNLPRQRILGPGPDALLDLAPDGAGGYRITRASPDAWRYYIAQGRDARGRLVTAPIETK